MDQVQASRGRTPEAPAGVADRERAEVLVLLARARWAMGATTPARETFVEAARIARRLGDGEILARAALGVAGRTDVTPGVNPEAVALMEEALAEVGDAQPLLGAELMARLGTELVPESASRADALTSDALAAAQASGDDATLAYALSARHFVLQRPDVAPADRVPLLDRAIALVEGQTPSDVLALCLVGRILDTLEMANGNGFDECLDRLSRLSEALGQPFFLWLTALFRATRLQLVGAGEDAEEAARHAFEIGQRLGTPNAATAFAAQLYALRARQGRLRELAPLLRSHAEEQPGLPLLHVAHAAAAWSGGADGEAHMSLEAALQEPVDAIAQAPAGLGVLGLIAPAVVRTESLELARRLVDAFAPLSGRVIVIGYGAAVLGAVDHHLGCLYGILGEPATAREHLAAAERAHLELGAPAWAAETREARRAFGAS